MKTELERYMQLVREKMALGLIAKLLKASIRESEDAFGIQSPEALAVGLPMLGILQHVEIQYRLRADEISALLNGVIHST